MQRAPKFPKCRRCTEFFDGASTLRGLAMVQAASRSLAKRTKAPTPSARRLSFSTSYIRWQGLARLQRAFKVSLWAIIPDGIPERWRVEQGAKPLLGSHYGQSKGKRSRYRLNIPKASPKCGELPPILHRWLSFANVKKPPRNARTRPTRTGGKGRDVGAKCPLLAKGFATMSLPCN